MTSPIVTRLVKGFAAHGFSQVLVIVTQIVSVPLFLSKWGPVRYGEWIALTALPGYLAITDLSFAGTAANQMTMLAGADRRDEAQRVFRSVWVLILALSALALAIASTLVLVTPFDRWLKLGTFNHHEAVLTTLFLVGQIVLAQQGSVIGAAFRSGGYYATGVWANDSLKFFEFLALVGIVTGGGGPVVVTGVVLVLRAVNYLVQYLYVRRLVPWLSLGVRGATLDVIRPLVGPALAYTALPLAQATTLQGTVLVVNQVVGPTGVVVYNATRTVTRIVIQAVGMVSNAAWPEFSRAIGAGDLDIARRLHRRVCQVGVWLGIVVCTAIALSGPFLYHHWTRGKAPFRPDVFAIMLVDVVIACLWNVSYIVPLSVNRHQQVTFRYLAATLAGLLLSYVLGRFIGLPGVALALIPVDLYVVAVVVPISMRLLGDQGGYLELVRPPFHWLLGRARGMARRDPEDAP